MLNIDPFKTCARLNIANIKVLVDKKSTFNNFSFNEGDFLK